MNAEFRRVKEIFLAAVEKQDEAERTAFLHSATGQDEGVLQQVERLLAAHNLVHSGLGPPGVPPPLTQTQSSWPLDTHVGTAGDEAGVLLAGRYKLVEPIGEGGMGTVWLAQQTEPVKRLVAVKLVKPGMDGRQMLARFWTERQALAVMDHPHIAKVLDGGATESGRPYFVMELVQGVCLTQFCDEHRLPLRDRLGLFVDVCQAVQHAHQKGIIHRDLKPGNVLVTRQEGKPAVKVIDFGLAKAVGEPLTDKPVNTQLTQMVGTPLYMSPEQAGLSLLDIDTRTDIYALGVLLYELLVGMTPFDQERLAGAGFDEIRRIIREEEPPRPSVRIVNMGPAAHTASAHRRSDPKRLSRLCRGELDWIVMKALEKDRKRRYESASAFAADVQRYLQDEPVLAGPPSVGYRLKKFVKRHRASVLATTVVLLALVASIVGTTLGLVEAWHQQGQKEQARKDAETNAGKAREETARAKAEKDRAEWLLYASQINLAQQAWEGNNVKLAFHHLNACRRDCRGWEHDYLLTLFNSNQRTLLGHERAVVSAAYSPDGRRIVSGGYDKTVRVWDAATGTNLMTLTGHTDLVYSVAFSPDGRRIASGSTDKTVRVWDAVAKKDPLILGEHAGGITCLAFSLDGESLASGGFDSKVRVWDLATGKCLITLTGHEHSVYGVAFSPDGRSLVSGSTDGTARLWDVATSKERQVFANDISGILGVAFSPDGKSIAVACGGGAVRVWDVGTGREVRLFYGHKETAYSVAFSADGGRVVSASEDQTVRVWSLESGAEILALRGHTDQVHDAAFSPDGRHIVSAGGDHGVKIWEANTAQGPLTVRGAVLGLSRAAISGDGSQVACGGGFGMLKIIEAATGQETQTFEGNKGVVESLAFSSEGHRLLSATQDGAIRVWDTVTGRSLIELKGKRNLGNYAAFSADGQRIVGGDFNVGYKVWDAITGQEILTLRKLRTGSISSLAFSPDGVHLAVGLGKNVLIWDVDADQEALTLKGHEDRVESVVFSSDGSRVVTGSSDGTVRVWDANSGQEILTLSGHSGRVNCVAISPDNRRVFSGSEDKTIKVWAGDSGTEVLSLKAHRGGVAGVAFSSKAKRLVSWSTADGAVKIWDASVNQKAN